MADQPKVHIVNDDDAVRDSVKLILEAAGFACATYASAEAFLNSKLSLGQGCALVDVRMPQMDGLALLQELTARRSELAVIIMTGFADVPLAVRAMKAGAADFVEKPCTREMLVAAVERALAKTAPAQLDDGEKKAAQERLDTLTQREREVLELLVVGDPNKVVAHKLGISPRTVEVYRGRIMEKVQVKSLAALVRVALAAGADRSRT